MIAWVAAALAEPASLDLELYRPAAGPDLIYGVGSPGFDKRQVSAGLLVHYTHDPLVLVRQIGVNSAVVRNRATFNLHTAWQFHPLGGIEVAFPMMNTWGAEATTYASDTAGAGDLRLAGHVGPLHRGPVRASGRVEVIAPIGTRLAWMGEGSLRVIPSVVADLRVGRLTAAGDIGVNIRPLIVQTTEGLRVGSELLFDLGVGWDLWPEKARATLSMVNRHGLVDEASNHALELVAALEVRPTTSVSTYVLVGRGLSAGYGAPDLRAGLGILFTPGKAPVEAAPLIDEDDDFVTSFALEDRSSAEPVGTSVPVAAAPLAKARVESNEIVLLEPVQFEKGTARILPESLPTLAAVAHILNTHAEILQLVIEGHASEEGGYAYNYDLSLSRASAVYKELVGAGVHPDRLSCRSVGEVEALTTAPVEADDLAQKRRVLFHITQWLKPGEPAPTYSANIVLPWTGESAATVTPPPPPPPPPPAWDPKKLEEEDE